jgi:hypothetical protein
MFTTNIIASASPNRLIKSAGALFPTWVEYAYGQSIHRVSNLFDILVFGGKWTMSAFVGMYPGLAILCMFSKKLGQSAEYYTGGQLTY